MMSQKDVGTLWENSILEATDSWLLLANHEARDVQAPYKYAHTQSKQRRNPRNMGLSSKSQKKGHGHEFLARSQQRNHGCEFLAKAHNGGYTQSNPQRSHDRKSLERIYKKAIAIIIYSRI